MCELIEGTGDALYEKILDGSVTGRSYAFNGTPDREGRSSLLAILILAGRSAKCSLTFALDPVSSTSDFFFCMHFLDQSFLTDIKFCQLEFFD